MPPNTASNRSNTTVVYPPTPVCTLITAVHVAFSTNAHAHIAYAQLIRIRTTTRTPTYPHRYTLQSIRTYTPTPDIYTSYIHARTIRGTYLIISTSHYYAHIAYHAPHNRTPHTAHAHTLPICLYINIKQ